MEGRASLGLSWILTALFTVLPTLIVPLGVAASVSAALAAERTCPEAVKWKGTREVRDGVAHVWNPADPMEGTIDYELRELWRLESERPDGSLVFGVVEDVTEDADRHVLVLDSQLHCVHRISPTGEYLGSIGREGDGPGEFRFPTEIFVTDDRRIGVVDMQIGKVVFLDALGKPRGQWGVDLAGFKRAWIVSIFRLPNAYVVQMGCQELTEKEATTTYAVRLCSSEGKPERSVLDVTHLLDRNHPYDFVQERDEALMLEDVALDGRILVSPSYKDYRLFVYDQDGTLRSVIERDYDPLERTQEEKDSEQAYWEGLYRSYRAVGVEASSFHRTVADARLKPDGTIWVVPSRGWKYPGEGIAERCDVFDEEGAFIREVVLRRAFSPEDDTLIQLADRWVVVEAGTTAEMTAVGAGTQHTEPVEERLPVIVCCEAVPVGWIDSDRRGRR
jgi:hypothetical protein